MNMNQTSIDHERMCYDRHPQILVIDDDEQVLKCLSRALKNTGYTVHTFDNAVDGLAFLEDTAVDVVISDHMMPGMKGTELLSKLRERYPDICRILLTGKADYNDALQAVNEGEVFRIITKPFETEGIKAIIRMALDCKFGLQPP
jgi:DNA-binding NtrC family response regulator